MRLLFEPLADDVVALLKTLLSLAQLITSPLKNGFIQLGDVVVRHSLELSLDQQVQLLALTVDGK